MSLSLSLLCLSDSILKFILNIFYYITLDDLASDVGDLKNGLAGAKAQIETQGKEFHGKINEVKSEMTKALNQQGAKFDQEIKNLDTKISTLSSELSEQSDLFHFQSTK